MIRGIREPGRSCSTAEDAVLRTVLSVLSAEEMIMNLQQPSGIGRRPTNVSADSMLVTPELKPEDLYPIRRYMNYTPPPKGYLYEMKDSVNSNNTGAIAKNKIRAKLNKTEYREVFPHQPVMHNLSFHGMPSEPSHFVPVAGRPICKSSYNFSLPDGI